MISSVIADWATKWLPIESGWNWFKVVQVASKYTKKDTFPDYLVPSELLQQPWTDSKAKLDSSLS